MARPTPKPMRRKRRRIDAHTKRPQHYNTVLGALFVVLAYSQAFSCWGMYSIMSPGWQPKKPQI